MFVYLFADVIYICTYVRENEGEREAGQLVGFVNQMNHWMGAGRRRMEMAAAISLDGVRDKNVMQLKKLNTALFPVRYNDKYYADALASGDFTKLGPSHLLPLLSWMHSTVIFSLLWSFLLAALVVREILTRVIDLFSNSSSVVSPADSDSSSYRINNAFGWCLLVSWFILPGASYNDLTSWFVLLWFLIK